MTKQMLIDARHHNQLQFLLDITIKPRFCWLLSAVNCEPSMLKLHNCSCCPMPQAVLVHKNKILISYQNSATKMFYVK